LETIYAFHGRHFQTALDRRHRRHPRPGSIGRQILNNLFEFEFNGKIFPVNPRYEYIHSTKAYASVEDIPIRWTWP